MKDTENNTQIKSTSSVFKRIVKIIPPKYLALLLLVVILIVSLTVGITRYLSFESKTTKLGFEDIGELATQAAYCTQVGVIDSRQNLWGMSIPFSQSKYIYTYDYVIKAGFDFTSISWVEKDSVIEVSMPEPIVISNQRLNDSFKVFHEKESVFNQIDLSEQNAADIDMDTQVLESAIANGLFDQAKENAESILKVFFANGYDPNTYSIKFIYP